MSTAKVWVTGLDFETYCELSLPEVGLARYVNHPTFLVTLASVATPGGVIDCMEFPAHKSELLRRWLDPEHTLISAHNAGFERAVLRTLGLDDIQVHDSAVVAAMMGADRHLAGAARQLLDRRKLDEDRTLLDLFAKRQKDQPFPEFDTTLPATHAAEWDAYKEYCNMDAELSREITTTFMGSNLDYFFQEMEFAQITLEMNEAGWPVDVDSVVEMKRRYEQNLAQLQQNFAANVDADLNLNSHVQVKKWCADRGVTSRSFDKINVERMISRLERLPQLKPGQAEVLELLRVKQALGGSSLKKLETILTTQHEGRVFYQYVHAGASQSMRTSGRSIQMQNLPQLKLQREMYELHVRPETDWTNDELAGNLRQVFTSSRPLGSLIVADFASIESRALAYQAGEDWKTQAYRLKRDVYKEQAVKIFGLCSVDDVTKEQRTTGKVGELSCGYGAGPVAVKDFAAKMHVDLSETEAGKLVRDWRQANPNIVRYWNDLGTAFHTAVEQLQQQWVSAGDGMMIKFKPVSMLVSLERIAPAGATSIWMEVWKSGSLLFRRVFHGCYLRGSNIGYWKPSLLKGGRPWKDRYVDPKTKRQRYYELYGGKIAGILTQSLCREIFFEALREIRIDLQTVPNAKLIGQFHDEVVIDWWPGSVSRDDVKLILDRNMRRSATHPTLPMGVEVKHDFRYTK